MMTNLDALYKEICKNPSDDTIRLVYADCLDEQGDDDSRTLAEYIRLSIALEHPPQTASMTAISEWKARETLQAQQVKRMWEKWSQYECPKCHNKDGVSIPSGRHGEARYYPQTTTRTKVCPTCNRTGDILREKVDTSEEQMTGFVATVQSIAQRRLTFRRGLLNAVWTTYLNDVWINNAPTHWARAIVENTPIDCFMVNTTRPSSIRIKRRKYKYRWFIEDNENQLVMGRLPSGIFNKMWKICKSEQRIKVEDNEWIMGGGIECSSPQEANELLGRALGMMVRESVYGAKEHVGK